MPTSLSIHKIVVLRDFTDYIESRLPQEETLLFRGCGSVHQKLLPSLFRHHAITDIKALLELETKVLGRFKQRSLPYHSRELTDEWENLFFMQHYGIPTRLLDWTENPYIALYFALTSAHMTSGQYKDDAGIWVLNPAIWNCKVLQHIGYNAGILSLGDASLDAFKPSFSGIPNIAAMTSEPVAMYGTHNSARIVAQRGAFTIFGKNTSSMEEIFVNSDFPAFALAKLVIPADKIESLLKMVIAIGITDSVVFPDLEGLAKETKRFFGFKV